MNVRSLLLLCAAVCVAAQTRYGSKCFDFTADTKQVVEGGISVQLWVELASLDASALVSTALRVRYLVFQGPPINDQCKATPAVVADAYGSISSAVNKTTYTQVQWSINRVDVDFQQSLLLPNFLDSFGIKDSGCPCTHNGQSFATLQAGVNTLDLTNNGCGDFLPSLASCPTRTFGFTTHGDGSVGVFTIVAWNGNMSIGCSVEPLEEFARLRVVQPAPTPVVTIFANGNPSLHTVLVSRTAVIAATAQATIHVQIQFTEALSAPPRCGNENGEFVDAVADVDVPFRYWCNSSLVSVAVGAVIHPVVKGWAGASGLFFDGQISRVAQPVVVAEQPTTAQVAVYEIDGKDYYVLRTTVPTVVVRSGSELVIACYISVGTVSNLRYIATFTGGVSVSVVATLDSKGWYRTTAPLVVPGNITAGSFSVRLHFQLLGVETSVPVVFDVTQQAIPPSPTVGTFGFESDFRSAQVSEECGVTLHTALSVIGSPLIAGKSMVEVFAASFLREIRETSLGQSSERIVHQYNDFQSIVNDVTSAVNDSASGPRGINFRAAAGVVPVEGSRRSGFLYTIAINRCRNYSSARDATLVFQTCAAVRFQGSNQGTFKCSATATVSQGASDCFDGAATVRVVDGQGHSNVQLPLVSAGATVLSVDDTGLIIQDTVRYVPHRNTESNSQRWSEMIRIRFAVPGTADTYSSIHLSPPHLVYTQQGMGDFRLSKPVQAYTVLPGQYVWVEQQNRVVASRVLAVDLVPRKGQFSAAVGSGRVFVNGVLCSSYVHNHALGHSMHSLHRVVSTVAPLALESDSFRRAHASISSLAPARLLNEERREAIRRFRKRRGDDLGASIHFNPHAVVTDSDKELERQKQAAQRQVHAGRSRPARFIYHNRHGVVKLYRASYEPVAHGSADRDFSLAAETNSAGSRFGANDQAERFRDAVPRWGYPKEFEPDSERYYTGVAATAAPGVVLSVLSLVFGLLFCLCRACFNCCCKDEVDPTAKMPTKSLACFLFLAVVCTTFAIVGMNYSEKLHEDVHGNTGLSGIIGDLLDDTLSFLASVRQPLVIVSNNVDPIVTQLVNLIAGVEFSVNNGVGGLTTRLSGLSNFMDGVNFTISNITFICDFCQTAATDINAANNQITTNTGPVLTTMAEVISLANTELTTQANEIKSQIQDAVVKLDDFNHDALKYRVEAARLTREGKKFDNYRRGFTVGLLLIPLSAVLVGVLAACLKKGWPFTFMYIMGFTMLFFTWLLFALHMPPAVLMGDVCVWLDANENNFIDEAGEDAGTVINACLDNTSLTVAYNVSDDLDFANRITFGDDLFVDASTFLNFSLLTAFSSEVEALTLATFGFDSTTTDTYIAALNQITVPTTGIAYNRTTTTATVPAKTCCGASNESAVETFRNLVVEFTSIENQLLAFLGETKRRTRDIIAFTNALEANLTTAQSSIQNVQTIIAPITNAATLFNNTAYCGFLGNAYGRLKERTCNDTVNSITLICLALFLVSVFGTPLVCCAASLAQSIGYYDDGQRQARKLDEEYAEQENVEIGTLNADQSNTLENGTA